MVAEGYVGTCSSSQSGQEAENEAGTREQGPFISFKSMPQ
jgi:hypothetical protein